MRLEKLRRELVALADFRPVILVHRDLRPRFGIEIRVTPDGGDQIRRSDGGLFAESPTVQQLVDVRHATFPPQPQLPASAPGRRRGNLMPPGDHERRERFGGRLDFLHFALGRSHENRFHTFSSFPAGIALLHERCLHLEVIERRPVRAHHNRVSLRGRKIHVHRVAIGIDLEMQKRRPRWSTRWYGAHQQPEQIGIRGGGILFRRPQVDREAMREVQCIRQ